MEDKIQAILNDPEKLKSAFEMASKIMGGTTPQGAETPVDTPNQGTQGGSTTEQIPVVEAKPVEPKPVGAALGSGLDIGAVLQAISGFKATGDGGGGLGGSLPKMLEMVGGNKGGGNRANLLNAIKPYVKTARVGHIDRAVKVANMAKNARSALGNFKAP